MEHHGFPADETLAEFIDGRLDAEGRQRVIEHMATCPECYDTFLTATEFAAVSPENADRPAGGEVVRGRFGRRVWSGAAAAMVALLAIGLIPYRGAILARYDEWSFGRRTGMAALVDAAKDAQYRPVEPRFSGGFEYKKKKPRYRGNEQEVDYSMLPVVIASSELQKKGETAKEKQYGAAVGAIFTGDAAAGAATLEEILHAATAKASLRDAISTSEDKRLLNDLASAWIVRSSKPGGKDDKEHDANRRRDLQLAEAAADRALQLDPHYAEAAYNRALAIDELGQHKQAIEAWAAYQKIEPDPHWREEAQDKIETAREDLKFETAPPPSR